MTTLLLTSLIAATTFPAGKVARIEITSVNGNVRVHAVRSAQVGVTAARGLAAGAVCAVDAQLHGGTLTIKAQDDHAGCYADLDVPVPAHADVSVDSAAGDVFVSGLRGGLSVHIGKGSAVVGGVLSALDVRLEHGSLSATGVVGDAKIKIETGNMQLWYDAVPHRGGVMLDMGHGNATVAFPGAECAVRAQLLAGKVQSAVTVSDGASFVIDGVISAGNLYIRRVAKSP